MQIEMTKSSEELKYLVSSDAITEFLLRCGLNPSKYMTITKKPELLKAIWLHFIFFEVHAELQQFKKGFRETLQMNIMICHNPMEMRALLVPADHKMTAKSLLDLFTVNYSEDDSKRCLEDQVVTHWRRYIVGLETESMYI